MNSSFMNTFNHKYGVKLKPISSQHPAINHIKHIKNNTSQDSERYFLAEGIWAHQKLVKTDLKLQCLLICPELIYSNEAVDLAESCINKAEESFMISKKLLEKICERDEPDGFVSIVQIPDFGTDKLHLKNNAIILVVDGLETPGNIGTILRTCDGAGVDAVFICNKKARVTNPKLVKCSMGAVFTIPIIEFDDTSICAKWLKDHNFKIYLADTRADKTYKSFDYDGNTALVMGSERY